MSNKVVLNGQELYPARYFTAQDLPVDKAFIVIIKRVTKEEMNNPQTHKKELKPVIYFVKPIKGTVMGDEFAESIAQALQEWNADNWPGQKIVIERKQVRPNKEGIRARAVASNNAIKTAPEIAEDEDEDANAD